MRATEREISSFHPGLARLIRSVRSTKHQLWLATTQDREGVNKQFSPNLSTYANVSTTICLNVGDIKCYFNKFLTSFSWILHTSYKLFVRVGWVHQVYCQFQWYWKELHVRTTWRGKAPCWLHDTKIHNCTATMVRNTIAATLYLL